MSIMEDAISPPETSLTAELCVLASGSAGNCSVLTFTRGGVRRACLIDLGLSPRRTVRLLGELGLGLHHIDDAVVTHLDTDHFHAGWAKSLPRHTTLHMHARHAESSPRFGLFGMQAATFDTGFKLRDGTAVRSALAAHDGSGVATFRFCIPGGCLGFATDLGRMTDRLVEHLAGVDVLAIESNYCPVMQENSDRPVFLKQRIMGGSGHLSNHETVEAIRRISPRSHVVLLHLSRQCNDPELVARLHEGMQYGLTITNQERPSGWVRVAAYAG
jgi:hypothetical protein